jgi:hypothetical protein
LSYFAELSAGWQQCRYSCLVGGVDFWIFRALLHLNLDWQKNSKTKVEKVFFFNCMSSYAEMSFWDPKKIKKSLNRVKIFVANLEPKTVFGVFWLYLLNGASYKSELPHFEISVNCKIFLYPY